MIAKRVAAAVFALAGMLMLAGCEEEPPPVVEEEPQFETRTLAYAEGADVRVMTVADDRMETGGLLVEGDGASYTGGFNAVFQGNMKISFGFCRGGPAAYRRFTLTFASATDPSQTFSVIYQSSEGDWTLPVTEEEAAEGKERRGQSGVYVQCGEEKRTTRYWGNVNDPNPEERKLIWQNNDNFNLDEALASPMFGGEGENESEFGKQYGSLELKWTANNVLEVYASERDGGYTPRLIAAFDGSAEGLGFRPGTLSGYWGLPRMEISAGYTVTFRSEVYDGYFEEAPNAPDVYFSQFVLGSGGQERTYSLAAEKIDEPPFYAAKNTK